MRTVLATSFILMLATMVISSTACYVLSLMVGGAAHWCQTGPACDAAFKALHWRLIEPRLADSLLLGLWLSPLGCVPFLADLRRQSWLARRPGRSK